MAETKGVTEAGAYLLLARYNRAKWNDLKRPAATTRAVGYGITPEPEEPQADEQDEAHEQAELLFPENYYPVPQLTEAERACLDPLINPGPLPPAWKGVRMLHSFHSNMFAWLHEKIPDIDEHGTNRAVETPVQTGGDEPKKTPSEIVNEMMTSSGTGYDDPGIGWLAVVDAGEFPTFIEHMGGKVGPLWRMYDIEVIPLNQDRTTWDVYKFMTPVSWNK